MQEILIRQYAENDRASVRAIAANTAFLGKPCEAFFSDRETLADFLTLYFTDYEPQSCFIAESNHKVIGYIIGSINTNYSDRIFRAKILPLLLFKMSARLTLLRSKERVFLFNCILSFFKGEFNAPDFSRLYPATLHINIEEGFRNTGIGSRLISRFLGYLAQEGIKAVRLATLSPKASAFFEKNGFRLLYHKRRSYFRRILFRDINCLIYGRQV